MGSEAHKSPWLTTIKAPPEKNWPRPWSREWRRRTQWPTNRRVRAAWSPLIHCPCAVAAEQSQSLGLSGHIFCLLTNIVPRSTGEETRRDEEEERRLRRRRPQIGQKNAIEFFSTNCISILPSTAHLWIVYAHYPNINASHGPREFEQ